MKRLLLLTIAALCGAVANSQLLTWTPPFPKEADAAQTLVITVDASKGNMGLLNYTPVTDVYVHMGVITNLSTSSSDWRHAPFTWATTLPAANAVSLGGNKWKFTITGSLRTFFGLTDPNETIQKIAILFRNGNGNSAQRNIDGSDMYIPVYGTALAARVDQPASQPKYTPVAEPQSWIVGTNFTIVGNANKTATLKLYHNGTLLGIQANATTITANSTVTVLGNQQIVLEANDGTTTKFDTVNVFVSPASSPTAALPAGLRDGVNYEPGDTSVTLVLRAPGKNIASVVGDFNNWTQSTGYIMNKTPDGKFFWIRLHPLTPGTEYAFQYIVDNNIKIADPYAEKILDPANDPFITSATYPNLKAYPAGQSGIVSVLQTAEPAYTWNVNNFNRPDKRGLVIYELLVRDFVAAHDWKTIRDSLNYLKKLGINAIELMPVNEFEGNVSWGYNPDFYFTPDKYYGPKNTFKSFIDSCHKNGMAVIMDIALNHSFGQSPMVQLYFDAANNRPATNNPWFNPVPKHAFNVGYDMNHESLDTRYFVSRVMENWVQQYKVDGFRFDLSKGFTQTQTCDANGANCNAAAMAAYDASRVAIWKRYYDSLQLKSPNAYAILEHFADNSEEIDLSNYGMMLWGNLNFAYTEAAKGNASDLSGGIYTVRNWTKPHLVTYMESHDEERIVYNTINNGSVGSGYNTKDTAIALKRMELDAAFLLTIPGPKMIWQFGELGYDYPINYCTNGTINNNCRLDPKPIKWDYLNDARRKSVYNTYSKLINLRFLPSYKDLFISGTISQSLNGTIKWIKLTSASDTSDLMVVGNFGVDALAANVTFPVGGTWYDYLNNTTFASTGSAQTFVLQPGEFHVYVNRNLNNVTPTAIGNIPSGVYALEVRIWPNPVIAEMVANIHLPQANNLTIEIYNSLGQNIGTLYKGFLIKGDHQLTLKRPPVTKGIYFLKVSTRSSVKTIQVNLQ